MVPFAQSSPQFLREAYPTARVIEIQKSYRSTWEIMEFARNIRKDVVMEPIRRHGERPVLAGYKDKEEEREALLKLAEDFRGAASGDGNGRLGIICKSYAKAEELYWWLAGHLEGKEGIHLFTSDSEEFYGGVMVTSVSMSKGLEFDEVVIPDVDDTEYYSEYDRGLLYVACTRAMHKLALLYCGEASTLLR